MVSAPPRLYAPAVQAYRKRWYETVPDIPYGYCWCGCGRRTSLAKQSDNRMGYVIREPHRFLLGHNCEHPGLGFELRDMGHDTPCWVWLRRKDVYGYGIRGVGGRPAKAHRWFYEKWWGAVPDGLELDHLCRVRLCVRPTHLEAVTHAENMRRGNLRKKLSAEQVRLIESMLNDKNRSRQEIADEFAVSRQAIDYINRHKERSYG